MAQANRMLALRLFGVPQARAQAVLKAAAAQGCPGLRLLSREEELVVCVNVQADSEAEASRICKQWNEYFREQFGPAVFGEGDTELAKAALTGLAKKHKLFVAADEATGHLLEARIRSEKEAAAVYDFGDHSYRHPTKADRLAPPRALLDKYPDCPVQPAAGRARQALALSGADWAVSYQPAQGVQPGFVLVCGAKTVYLHALPPSAQPGMLAANWILDMLRRLALGLEMAQGVQSFAYGKPAPVLRDAIIRRLAGAGFEVIDSPSKAGHILHVNIAAAGESDAAVARSAIDAGFDAPVRLQGKDSIVIVADALLVERNVPSPNRARSNAMRSITRRNAVADSRLRLGIILPHANRSPLLEAAVADRLAQELCRPLELADKQAEEGRKRKNGSD